VLRFNYEKKQAVVYEDGKVDFIDENFGELNQEKLLENCEKQKVDTYQQLLSKLKKETFSKTEKYYYLFLSENYFMAAVKEMMFDIKLTAFYKIENDGIANAIRKYFGIENNSGRVIIGTHQNHFNFITAAPILEILFVNADLEFRGEKVFNKFKIKKKIQKNKPLKFRSITAPHEEIKKPLKDFNKMLQYIYDKRNSDFQVAYKKGKNIINNAKKHVDKKFMYKVDLKDFFPSCKRIYVEKYLKMFFKNSPNKEVLQEEFLNIILDSDTDALFIGNPISGTLANVIISKPVQYIKNITNMYGMEFSVYADDMAFSSDRFISENFITALFNLAFNRYEMIDDFSLNTNKSYGMSASRRHVTGVTINHNNEMTINRRFYRNLRVKIHKLSLGEATFNLKKLQGQLAHATMVDYSGKILRLIKNFEPVLKQYNLISNEKIQELENRENTTTIDVNEDEV
jgi:RNA-directed DNA polymerase